MAKDYYSILGVSREANQEEIKKAFRKLAHQYHPDKQGGDEAKFKEVNEAYQVLSNTEKRSQYDQYGSTFEQAQSQGGFSGFDGFRDFSGFSQGFNGEDLSDMFGDIFGMGGGRRGRARTKKGRDVAVDFTITLEEAATGIQKTIELDKLNTCEKCSGEGHEPDSKQKTCPECKGQGRVTVTHNTILGSFATASTCPTCQGEGKKWEKECKNCQGTGRKKVKTKLEFKIPAGVNNGETIRLTSQGETGEKGAQPGDLYVQITIKPHNHFKRHGYDLLSEEKISFSQAALGDKIKVSTLEGEVSLKIPAGTQSGQVFKLKGKGIKRLQGFGSGDQFVTIKLETPTHLSHKQKKLFKELSGEND